MIRNNENNYNMRTTTSTTALFVATRGGPVADEKEKEIKRKTLRHSTPNWETRHGGARAREGMLVGKRGGNNV